MVSNLMMEISNILVIVSPPDHIKVASKHPSLLSTSSIGERATRYPKCCSTEIGQPSGLAPTSVYEIRTDTQTVKIFGWLSLEVQRTLAAAKNEHKCE